jgi:peptide/nickel transport system permease protein
MTTHRENRAALAVVTDRPVSAVPPRDLGAVLDRAAPGIWHRLRRRPATMAGLVLVAVHLLLALGGSLVAPYGATEQQVADRLRPPSAQFLMGTDQFGRDVLSRVIIGTRGILLLSGGATLLGLAFGALVGVAAGYAGGPADEGLMRLMDMIMSFPSLLLALLVLTMAGPSALNVVLAIAVVFMPRVARVVRSAVLAQRHQEYVQAARLRGERSVYVIVKEILPNVTAPIIVEGGMRISYAILLGASLGFLGLGVQPPSPDWGLMISEARSFLLVAPWMAIAPAFAMVTLVVGLNLVADGLSGEIDAATGR